MRNTLKQKEKHRTSRLKTLSLDSLTHGGVRGREIYLNFPPTRLLDSQYLWIGTVCFS